MDYKTAIIDALDVLRKRDVAEKQPFKARAYAMVIKQLQQLDDIHSFEDLQGIKGIGEQIEKKIKEVLATGSLRMAEKAKEIYHLDSLDAFQKIYGVGPVKATELVKLGYRTIDELKDASKKNSLLLNDKHRVGLCYYDDLLQRIPREEMDIHRKYLYEFLPAELVFDTEIVGSYRRKAETSGDIDMLIRVPTNVDSKEVALLLQDYVQTLQKEAYIEEVLALGDHKCMAICRIHPDKPARRLDLLIVPHEEYAYSLLYFTGSDRFNVAFRQHALTRGYTLNEHVLTPIREDVNEAPFMETEKDIFAFLGLRYIDPAYRVDHQQIISLSSKPKIGKNVGK
jgi:DNA polymerase/3'-5' exonuclease PolX